MSTDKDRMDWSESEGRALHGRLRALGVKVAAAESLTVGRVQAELGRWSGASAYFAGGLTAYEITTKERLLGIDLAHAVDVNAVSAQVATEMARGVAKLFGADVGVATTGYAEPDLARGVHEPFAWVALVWKEEVPSALRVEGPGLSREAMQMRATAEVLRLLAERARRTAA